MAEIPPIKDIEFLVDREFGSVRVRQARKTHHKSKQITDFRSKLFDLPVEEIKARVRREKEKLEKETAARAEEEERSRFYNQPGANADFDHWSKAAYWSLDEAVALSFGKEPEKVKWENVKAYTQVSPFAYQYQRRRDLAKRAVPFKQLFDPVTPGTFLAWANRNDIVVPSELEDAVKSRGTKVADWQSLYEDLNTAYEKLNTAFDENHQKWKGIVSQRDEAMAELQSQIEKLQSELDTKSEKSLSTRERESLLKLVIGMAVGGYGYDPEVSRSPIAKEIASDLATRGLSLDEDTVRKYLKEAKELLQRPEDEVD